VVERGTLRPMPEG